MAPSRSHTTLLPLLAAASFFPSASWAFDCKDIAASGVHFNLGELAGPHVVHWKNEDIELELLHKYNFTIDICDKLKWHKGGSLATECHHGARGMFSYAALLLSPRIMFLHRLTQIPSLRNPRDCQSRSRPELDHNTNRYRRNLQDAKRPRNRREIRAPPKLQIKLGCRPRRHTSSPQRWPFPLRRQEERPRPASNH
jgi:hypothetical protein